MTQKKEGLMVWKIAFTYIGSVIGAGFASGQEIYQFFVRYGKEGTVGIFFAGLLFIAGGVVLLQLSQRIQVEHYFEAFYNLLGKRAGFVVDLTYIVFIMGSVSVMLAGSGSIFQEVLGIRYGVGVLITLALVMVTVGAGVRGVLLMNTLLIPVLIVVILYTSLSHLAGPLLQVSEVPEVSANLPWYVSGTMYVSFNIFLAMALLVNIGSEVQNTRVLTWGGILGGSLLMIVLMAMAGALFLYTEQIRFVEMPMLELAGLSGPVLHVTYMVGLWIAMITTAVANVFGFMNRVMPLFKLNYYNCAMLTIIVVLPLTRFGFANLVRYLYPVYGVVAIGVLALMAVRAWRQ